MIRQYRASGALIASAISVWFILAAVAGVCVLLWTHSFLVPFYLCLVLFLLVFVRAANVLKIPFRIEYNSQNRQFSFHRMFGTQQLPASQVVRVSTGGLLHDFLLVEVPHGLVSIYTGGTHRRTAPYEGYENMINHIIENNGKVTINT